MARSTRRTFTVTKKLINTTGFAIKGTIFLITLGIITAAVNSAIWTTLMCNPRGALKPEWILIDLPDHGVFDFGIVILIGLILAAIGLLARATIPRYYAKLVLTVGVLSAFLLIGRTVILAISGQPDNCAL